MIRRAKTFNAAGFQPDRHVQFAHGAPGRSFSPYTFCVHAKAPLGVVKTTNYVGRKRCRCVPPARAVDAARGRALLVQRSHPVYRLVDASFFFFFFEVFFISFLPLECSAQILSVTDVCEFMERKRKRC